MSGSSVEPSSRRPEADSNAAIPEDQHRKKEQMTRQSGVLRIDVSTQGLSHAQSEPAQQGAPQRTHSADDDCFKGEDQLRRSAERIEDRADGEEQPAQGGNRHREGGGAGVNAAAVDANERGGRRV